MEFFDTNVLVASLVPRHLHHHRSLERLTLLQGGKGCFSAHSLVESFSTLTKRSLYQWPALSAARSLQHAAGLYETITLTPEETLQVLARSAEQGLVGPIIYDALLIACARKAGASRIYTWNVKHFRQVAPDLAEIISEP